MDLLDRRVYHYRVYFYQTSMSVCQSKYVLCSFLTHFYTRNDVNYGCPNLPLTMQGMAIQVVEYSSGGTKLERFLPKNQHTQRKLLHFGFVGRCKKLSIILESKVI